MNQEDNLFRDSFIAVKRKSFPFESKTTPAFVTPHSSEYDSETYASSDAINPIFLEYVETILETEESKHELSFIKFIAALSPLYLLALETQLDDIKPVVFQFILSHLCDDNEAYYKIVQPEFDLKWQRIEDLVRGMCLLHRYSVTSLDQLGIKYPFVLNSMMYHLGLDTLQSEFSLISIRFPHSELRHLNGGITALKSTWGSLCYFGNIHLAGKMNTAFIRLFGDFLKAGFMSKQDSEKVQQHLEKVFSRPLTRRLSLDAGPLIEKKLSSQENQDLRQNLGTDPLLYATETLIQGDLEEAISFLCDSVSGLTRAEPESLVLFLDFVLLMQEKKNLLGLDFYTLLFNISKRYALPSRHLRVALKLQMLFIDHQLRLLFKKTGFVFHAAPPSVLSWFEKIRTKLPSDQAKNLELVLIYRCIFSHYADALIATDCDDFSDLYHILKNDIQEDLIEHGIYMALEDLQVDIAYVYSRLDKLCAAAQGLSTYLETYVIQPGAVPFSYTQAERSLTHVYNQLHQISPQQVEVQQALNDVLSLIEEIQGYGLFSLIQKPDAPHFDKAVLLHLHNEAVLRLDALNHSTTLLTTARIILCLVFLELESSTVDTESLSYIHHLLYEIRSLKKTKSGLGQFFKRNPEHRTSRLKEIIYQLIIPRFNVILDERFHVPAIGFQFILKDELTKLCDCGSVSGLLHAWVESSIPVPSPLTTALLPPQETGLIQLRGISRMTAFGAEARGEVMPLTYSFETQTETGFRIQLYHISYFEGEIDPVIYQSLSSHIHQKLQAVPSPKSIYFKGYKHVMDYNQDGLVDIKWYLEEGLQLENDFVLEQFTTPVLQFPFGFSYVLAHLNLTESDFFQNYPTHLETLKKVMETTKEPLHFKLVQELRDSEVFLQNYKDSINVSSFSISDLKPYILREMEHAKEPIQLDAIKLKMAQFQKEFALKQVCNPENRIFTAIRLYKNRVITDSKKIPAHFNKSMHKSSMIEDFICELKL